MNFTIQLADGSSFKAYTIQESIRYSVLTQTYEKRFSIQGTADEDNDMDHLGELLNKEGNISNFSIYDGGNKIAAYTGYSKLEGITKTLQPTAQGWQFIIDIQLTR